MDEIYAIAGSGSTGVLEGILQPKRNGSKGLIPSAWLNRGLRVEYVDCGGVAQHIWASTSTTARSA